MTSIRGDTNKIIYGIDPDEYYFYNYILIGQIKFYIDFNQYDEYK